MNDRYAVGFDFDHTLGVDNGLEVVAYYRLATDLGRPLDASDPGWAAFIADILSRFRLGGMSLDASVAEFVERLNGASVPTAADRYRTICYELVDELVAPVDGARDVIAALDARDIPHAILTNGWSPLQHLKIARALDYRGAILVSDQIGILKPDVAAFAELVATLGVARERIWFVGDNPTTDVTGAKNAGLYSVWFDWENVRYPDDAPQPDRRIGDLRELLALLRGRHAVTENSFSQSDGHA